MVFFSFVFNLIKIKPFLLYRNETTVFNGPIKTSKTASPYVDIQSNCMFVIKRQVTLHYGSDYTYSKFDIS